MIISKKLNVQTGVDLSAAISVADHFDKNHATTGRAQGKSNSVHYEVEGQTYSAYHTATTISIDVVVEVTPDESEGSKLAQEPTAE